MPGQQAIIYRGETHHQLLIEPLDTMTLIYHRRSGITHIVAEPVPEILAAMNGHMLSAEQVLERLSADYEFEQTADALKIIAARLEELAALGLVERLFADVA